MDAVVTMREVNLKICDLCGAPNLMESTECHVCGWRGHFSTDPTKVRSVIEAARRLQRHCIAQEDAPSCSLKARLEQAWMRLQDWYRRRKRWHRSPFW